jgi:hypothetical protein
VAALAASRRGRTVLVAARLPAVEDPPRVEAVPARLLSTLLDFGIHPGAVGAERLHDRRVTAWEGAAPVARAAPWTAHVERPQLECALLAVLLASGRVTVVLDATAPTVDPRARRGRPAWVGAGWQAHRLIDATGRRAITATRRVRAPAPWSGRTFWAARGDCPATPEFRIAALPDGYAYRLGAATHVGLGFVGRGTGAVADPHDLAARLREAEAGWMLDGLPDLRAMRPGRTQPATVQWTAAGPCVRIGDAALARDVLSSQGLATGISEALYSAAIATEDDRVLFARRQLGQRAAHLTALGETVARCRFREAEPWAKYRTFLLRHSASPSAPSRPSRAVGLRRGRIVTLPPGGPTPGGPVPDGPAPRGPAPGGPAPVGPGRAVAI